MKKILLTVALICFSYISKSYSNEITNIEWDLAKNIQVTLYNPGSGLREKVSCTAFYKPSDNKPIGGAIGFYRGGIAQVNINIPESYEKKNLADFKITCY